MLSHLYPLDYSPSTTRMRTRMRILSIRRTLLPILLFSRMPFSAASELRRRVIQSNATCIDSFDWMHNNYFQSPCLVAAYLLSSCAGTDWKVNPIPIASVHYTPPGKTDANGCKCSWAVYNTLQACADCQGQNFESAMLSWSGYNGNCTGSLLSMRDYYPPETLIPVETAIPFWATINPSTWHDGIFDPSMAQSIANQGKADITQSTRSGTSSGKKKSNKGAIAGGVVGGVLFLLFLFFAFLFIRSRRNRRQAGTTLLDHQRKPSTARVRWNPLLHSRSTSETYTCKYNNPNHVNGLGYSRLTPSPGPTMISTTMTGGSAGATPFGGSPYYGIPSSNSFTPASTASPPPGDYIAHNTVRKSYPPVLPGMGMVAMTNNTNNRSSALSVTVSSAYATAGAPSTVAGGTSHIHTLSNDSAAAAFSLDSNIVGMEGKGVGITANEPPEGAITPYVLPPALPEPMSTGPDAHNGLPSNVANSISYTPAISSKSGLGGYRRGPDHVSATSNDSVYPTATTTSPHLTRTGTRRPPVERRNPPAYTFSPPDRSSQHSHAADTEVAQSVVDGVMSTDAHRAETTFSGTTLRGQEGESSVRAPTTVGEEVAPPHVDQQNADTTGMRGQHGSPTDQKI